VVLARLLTSADFGVVAMVTTFSLLLQSFGTSGFSVLSDCYVRHLTLKPDPIVIDVGCFIGDFALYAVKRLNA
jgi:hypothetical protein